MGREDRALILACDRPYEEKPFSGAFHLARFDWNNGGGSVSHRQAVYSKKQGKGSTGRFRVADQYGCMCVSVI